MITEKHLKKHTESQSPKKMIQFQMDLFEEFDETNIVCQEIDSLRTSLHKLRRKLFRELDELQTQIKGIKEENMKLKFFLFQNKEEEKREELILKR